MDHQEVYIYPEIDQYGVILWHVMRVSRYANYMNVDNHLTFSGTDSEQLARTTFEAFELNAKLTWMTPDDE